MPRLTRRSVEGLQPVAPDYFVWDDQIAGFGIRVMPSGARSYQVQHRKGGRGLSIQMVGKLLGHSQIQTTMRYAHLADDPVRQAALQVSDGLAGALGPLPGSPLRTAAQ